MKIIIVGCGKVGRTLAEKLNGDGNEVTVIDMDAEKIRSVTDRYDVMGIVGNGATHTVQRQAGIENADLFIAVTDSDELNLFCSLLAKKEGNCQTIARVQNPEYSKEVSYLQDELGLVMVINPEYAAAEEIARVLRFPSAMKIEPFGKGRVEIIKFRLAAESLLAGLSVKEMVQKFRANVLVCTVERGEEAYIPNGDFVFEGRDVVSIIATPKNANDFFENIRYKGHSVKNVMIVGGGAITHYLCEILERSGISIKVIEKDLKVCEEIARKWDKVTVIHGNASEKELLLEEGIERSDGFVALSSLDEENLLLSLFAKESGVKKIVSKIARTDYDSVISRLDLDTVICPKNITSDSILRYVRSTKNTADSNMENLYNIIQDKVEASEFIVKDGSSIVGKPLHTLRFKPNVLVASIVRGKEAILPRGNDCIQAGDSVIVVTKDFAIENVADVLER